MITALYNFVPLNKKVFYPPWAEDISHDIPFSDGESGEIEITIEAKSPIFIRDHKNLEEFFNFNGNYIIPGSSVKGMVRNVLEILSFSKMNFIDDRTYAVRDLRNPELYRDHFKTDKIYCGWLRKELDEYVIDDCGHPARIFHQEIDKATETRFSSYFSEDFTGTDKEKTAKYKYSLVSEDKLLNTFEYKKKNNAKQEVYRYSDSENAKIGTLVFTGQPTARKNTGKMGDGKGFEFIFFDIQDTLVVKKEVFENFKFAYFDGRKTNPKESPDWTYWKEKLYNNGRVPVFFRKDKDGNVTDFGLSYLYKLPYKNSVTNGLYSNHLTISDNIDLAEAIFGFSNPITKNSLKGRVQVSHFRATNNPIELSERTIILGTPRASYYPIYIKQQQGEPYKTYMDNNFIISGWKRYPIHKNMPNHQNEQKSKVTTTFKPLKQGAIFEGKIRFHNLKRAELGALISALTFHNSGSCYHNIGLAKPYGYGKVKITINNLKVYKNDSSDCSYSDNELYFYLKAFEVLMCNYIGKEWYKSEQITELFTMASELYNGAKYMTLDGYAKNKASGRDPVRNNHFLNKYSKIVNQHKKIDPINKVCLDKGLENRDFEEEDWNTIKESNREDIIRLFIKKYPNSEYKNEALKLLKKDKNRILTREEKEERAYKIALSANRLYEFEQFIQKYPNSPYISDIQNRINQIEQEKEKRKYLEEAEMVWQKIKDSNKIEDFEEYIQNYANSPYVSNAQTQIEELNKKIEKEKKAQENAKKAKNARKKESSTFANIISELNKGKTNRSNKKRKK